MIFCMILLPIHKICCYKVRVSTGSVDTRWMGGIFVMVHRNTVDEGMGANQLCRIVIGISSQIGRDGHRDMGDVSTYGKIIRNLIGSMKPPGSNLCADTRRYKYLRASQGVKTQRDLH